MNNYPLSINSLNELLNENENNEKKEKSTFYDLNLPKQVICSLKLMNIIYPSPIQSLSLKKALNKKNLIIQSRNGTGKSLSICIILISQIFLKMQKFLKSKVSEEKWKIFNIDNMKEKENYVKDDKKNNFLNDDLFFLSLFFFGIVLVPTRELCVQLYDNIKKISDNIKYIKDYDCSYTNNSVNNSIDNSNEKDDFKYSEKIYFKIKSIILYGGTNVFENVINIFVSLPNIIISTPGRLKHILSILKKLKMKLKSEKYNKIYELSYLKIVNILLKKLVIDEIDALLDEQFDDQIKIIFNYLITSKIQILCYSSTFLDSLILSFIKNVNCYDQNYLSKLKSTNLTELSNFLKEDSLIKEFQFKNDLYQDDNNKILENNIENKTNNIISYEIERTMNSKIYDKMNKNQYEDENVMYIKKDNEFNKTGDSKHKILKLSNKKIKKKKKKKKKYRNNNKSSNSIRAVEEMLQVKSIFCKSDIIRYIIKKMIKEKEKIPNYTNKQRDFEFIQTCTSLIIHSNGNKKNKINYHVNEITKNTHEKKIIEEKDNVPDEIKIKEDRIKLNKEILNSDEKSNSPVLLNIKHCFITINNENLNKKEELKYKMKVLLKIINEIKFNQCFLFINNTYEGIQITKMLNKFDISSYYTSSKIEHNERIEHFKNFQSNKIKIVVCTDVMSRGIDNIICDLVINFDIPQSKETYIHRSGRCGRYGKKGLCISLCNYSDYNYLYYFKYQLKLEVYDFYYICNSLRKKENENQNTSININLTKPNNSIKCISDENSESNYNNNNCLNEYNENENFHMNDEDMNSNEYYHDKNILYNGNTKYINNLNSCEQQEKEKLEKIHEYKKKNKKSKILKLNIKGFYGKDIKIIENENSSKSDVYLKIYFKKLVTKMKIVKSEKNYFFLIPNDNINFFKNINIIQHKSNLIIYFTFYKKIKIYWNSYFLNNLKKEKKKYCKSNFCMFFFCNSNNYMILKLFYSFIFFFKYFKYPFKENFNHLLIYKQNYIEKIYKEKNNNNNNYFLINKKSKWKQYNYISDSWLYKKTEKKNLQEKGKVYETDNQIYLNEEKEYIKKYSFPFFFVNRNYLYESFNYFHYNSSSSNDMDYNILEEKEKVKFNTLSLESIFISLNMSIREKKNLINFCEQCEKIQCKNNELEIIRKINNLLSSQIYLNLNTNENVNLLKSIFLQNHIKLHENF
ncbi:RNA helicase, putative [Plasmodium relictum]|uniref:RNA helicase, putative n=1 Tax=Plasmodium relictum TaxID=85471 RepID=A0A1J1H4U9_PLARL|nr:RNA helicase, putative [Plasmodium relictum]CRG98459.1 RNA helicase, putative [Plasmodium relictum]